MSEKNEIIDLLKNLQNGLKKYSLGEFNDAISVLVKDAKNYGNKEEVQLVLEHVCSNFNISKNQLIYSNARGNIAQARTMAYCLLHFEYNLPIRYISKKIFFKKWHGGVAVAIRYYKNLNMAIKPDREFSVKYQNIKQNIKGKNN
jgi:chromosomal replication initiation ATPase DnaA